MQKRARNQSKTVLQLRNSALGTALMKTVEITGNGRILSPGNLEVFLSPVTTKFCSLSAIEESEEEERWKFSPRDGIFSCRLTLISGVMGYIRE